MRYAEGPSTARRIRIAAGPERVWEILADVEAMARWSPELVRVEWQDGAGAPATGARYIGHNEHPVNGEWRTVAHFTECEPGRILAWCVLDAEGRYGEPAASTESRMATWSFTLEPEADGVLLTQTVTVGPGRSGLNAYIEKTPEHEEAIIAYRLDELGKGMEATLKGIKDTVETGPN
ncbi:SRPBCC family protein [Streptomyces sp. NPDC047973]|uniref:SRPBCC family protein n=1 Tax=Streptomyces sp. NPDC047973 TaxID=3155383 RepID=UPI0034191889